MQSRSLRMHLHPHIYISRTIFCIDAISPGTHPEIIKLQNAEMQHALFCETLLKNFKHG